MVWTVSVKRLFFYTMYLTEEGLIFLSLLVFNGSKSFKTTNRK